MCVVLEPAILSSTILLANQVEHEGKTVNVIGYQNTAKSKGPNAMVLPLPSAVPMSQANCIDMTGALDTFRAYEKLLRPTPRGLQGAKGGAACASGDIQVFDSGSYTVLLTHQTDLITLRKTLATLPVGLRIDLDVRKAKIFAAYKKFYPNWHLAICLWSGTIEAEPLLWWYEPIEAFVERHFLPGLDAHDGEPPDPDLKSVPVDHTIVVGTPGQGQNATSIVDRAPEHLRKWLPKSVFGDLLHKMQMRNGDWVLPKTGWNNNNGRVRVRQPRVPPPWAANSTACSRCGPATVEE